MGDVKAGAALQLRAAQHLTPQIALTAAANFRLSGQKHHGNDYRLSVSGKVWQSDSDSITLAADLRLADRDYQQTYFGVTPAQSARNGYRTYQPKAGVYGYGVSAGWMHQFNENWSAGIGIEALQLAGKAKNSPLVRKKHKSAAARRCSTAFRACLESAGKSEIPPPPQGEARSGGGVGVAILSTEILLFQLFAALTPALSLASQAILVAARAVPVPQGEGVYRRFYLLPFTQENRFSQTLNRLLKAVYH